MSGTLPVANGGTGATTLSANGVILGNGTGALTSTTGTANQILIANGTGVPTFTTASGDLTNTLGVFTLGTGSVTSAKILDGEIVNADINSSANIALTKLASGSSIVTSLTTPTGSNANGGSISSNVLTLSLADGTNPGLVSTTTQTLAGAKTFSSLLTGTAGATISGASTSINDSSNFATNINTGTSTGAVTIGGG